MYMKISLFLSPLPLSFSLSLSLFSLSLSLVSLYPQEAAKSLLLPILLDYITAFVEILGSPLPSNSDNLLRKEVIMTLCQLLRSFSRPLNPHIMSIVTPVWNILVSNTPSYPSNKMCGWGLGIHSCLC